MTVNARPAALLGILFAAVAVFAGEDPLDAAKEAAVQTDPYRIRLDGFCQKNQSEVKAQILVTDEAGVLRLQSQLKLPGRLLQYRQFITTRAKLNILTMETPSQALELQKQFSAKVPANLYFTVGNDLYEIISKETSVMVTLWAAFSQNRVILIADQLQKTFPDLIYTRAAQFDPASAAQKLKLPIRELYNLFFTWNRQDAQLNVLVMNSPAEAKSAVNALLELHSAATVVMKDNLVFELVTGELPASAGLKLLNSLKTE